MMLLLYALAIAVSAVLFCVAAFAALSRRDALRLSARWTDEQLGSCPSVERCSDRRYFGRRLFGGVR